MNRKLVLPWPTEILAIAAIGGGYATALLVLKWPRARFHRALPSMQDLLKLISAATLAAAFVATAYAAILVNAGLLSTADFRTTALRYWIADVVGILAVAPSALLSLSGRRILPLSIETAFQCAAIAAALTMVFDFSAEREFQLFYVLLLPIVWMAMRNGIEGASAGILITQIGVIIGIALLSDQRKGLVALQAFMLVLTVTGLIAGESVTERRRVESQLQLHRESIARLSRLGSMGELAAAIAHEVNQPLTAAGTFARLMMDVVSSGSGPEAIAIAKKAVAQIDRAAEVIRRLRALVRIGRSERLSASFERIAKQTIELCRHDLEQGHVATRLALASGLPAILVDALQIEQVLLNLLRNSIEAIRDSGRRGSIIISATEVSPEFVEVRVSDSGPGFSPEQIEGGILPLSSTKAGGLGIGLSLSKSIVEAHGGRLWLDAESPGATVRFTLPVAKERNDG